MKSLALALACGLTMLATAPVHAASFGNVVAFDPTPVTVPEGIGRKASIRAVAQAFVMRGWRITGIDTAEGYVDAEYPIRVHVARVRARLSDDRVTFHYRDSEKIEHGWKVRTKALSRDEDPFGINDARDWRLAEEPSGKNSTLMVHPKYQEWVQDVSRTLEGTLRLATLGG